MILHEAVLSEDRRIVGRAQRAGRGSDFEVHSQTTRQEIIASEPVASLVCNLDLPSSRREPAWDHRLSFEAVAAWLAVQDTQTRTACACMLADELTQVRESARSEGYAAGQEEGRAAANQAAANAISAIEGVARSAEAAFTQEQHKLTELCVEIVAEAFAKIAGVLLPTRQAAIGAVAEVLKRAKEARELTIRVSPAELPLLQQEEARLAAVLPGRRFSLVADPRVEMGGCIVDSKLGSLDGRLEVQLRELYETLRAAKSVQAERS